MTKKKIAAVIAIVVFVVVGFSSAGAYAMRIAAATQTATCTANPAITETSTTQNFTVNCQVPKKKVTTTATATATTTVTATATATATATQTVTATPTASDTPTPTVTPTDTQTPNPTGFPDASNTGVPAGTVLTNYTGPMIITVPGTVIDSKNITGDLRIEAANVVVKNSKVYGDVRIDADDSAKGYSLTVQDTTVDAGPADGSVSYDGTGIGAVDFTALRVNVFHGKRSINCFLKCTVQDSYLHGQANPDSTYNEHESGVRMGDTSTIVHNTIACEGNNNAADGGCSADLTGYGDFAPVQNNLIKNNLFKAQLTGGGTCAYGGASGGKPYSNDSNNIRFISNVFERGTNKSDHGLYICGYYASSMDFDPSAPGNVWSGNTYDDGTSVGPNATN